MFLSQIYDIETEIAHLQEQLRESQEKLQQYQHLREKASDAIALIKEIQEQAANIGEVHHWQSAVLHALEIDQPTPPTPPEPTKEDPKEDLQQAQEIEPTSFLSEAVETPQVELYATPDQLAAALENEDTDTVLMGIANVLDCVPATEIEGKVWYFVQNLPLELCDRVISYLPKSIIPTWKQQAGSRKQALEMASAPTQQEVTEEEARASIFPAETPTEYEYQPERGDVVECKNNGLVGQVSYVCDSPNGRMASVRLPGGTSNFHISNLRFIGKGEEETATPQPPQEEAPVSEVDQLAKQCLGLRSWSQIRIFADSNPDVITRMQQLARTKAEKRLINNLPALVVGYIQRANDRSDLQWLPEPILSEVETLIQNPAPTTFAQVS